MRGGDLLVQGDDRALSLEDGFKLLEDGWAGVGVFEEQRELVVGGVGEAIELVEGVALADVEANGFASLGGDAKAVNGGGRFEGLRVGVDGPAGTGGVLDDDHVGLGSGVMDEVLDLGDVSGGLLQDAFADGEVLDAVGVIAMVDGDADGLVGGVGEETPLAGVDGVEEAFAGETAVLDDGEGAAIEGEVGDVGDPERAQGLELLWGPEGDTLGVDLGLEDGDEGGLVAANGDGLGEVVGEVVVEGAGGGVGSDGVRSGGLVGDGSDGLGDGTLALRIGGAAKKAHGATRHAAHDAARDTVASAHVGHTSYAGFCGRWSAVVDD